MKCLQYMGRQQWYAPSEGIERMVRLRGIARGLGWGMRFWLERYLLAEAVALVVAVLGVTLATMLTTNELILVAASVYSGSASYYGVLVACTLIADRRAYQTLERHAARRAVIGMVRGLILEFGSAEVLDSLLFSPVLLYLCLRMLPNPQLAVVLSELASTIAFYTTVLAARAAREAFA